MNLLNTRKRISVAERGHDILKRKREVLVGEFLKLIKDSRGSRLAMRDMLQQGYKSVAIASTYVGDFELDSVAAGIKEAAPLSIVQRNVMGVKIPEISAPAEKDIFGEGYSILSTSAAIDDVRDSFERITGMIIDVARREQGLKRLVLEIDKTKRRVNALEYVLIPNLSHRAKYMSMRLDEMDRDMFAALKHVKKRLAKSE